MSSPLFSLLSLLSPSLLWLFLFLGDAVFSVVDAVVVVRVVGAFIVVSVQADHNFALRGICFFKFVFSALHRSGRTRGRHHVKNRRGRRSL